MEFLSSAKNLSSKYGIPLFDTTAKTELDAASTVSEKLIYKTAETKG